MIKVLNNVINYKLLYAIGDKLLIMNSLKRSIDLCKWSKFIIN